MRHAIAFNMPRPLENVEKSRTQWYKVSLPSGANIGEKMMMFTIKLHMKSKFDYQNYHTKGGKAMFFIQGTSLVDELKAKCRNMKTSSGIKLSLFAHTITGAPYPPLDGKARALLVEALLMLYNAEHNSLDLSEFNADNMRLERPDVSLFIAKYIAENMRELVILIVRGNNLSTINRFSCILQTCKNFTAMDLSGNCIKNTKSMYYLRMGNITELSLVGNPITKSPKYMEQVCKLFPKLEKLDGITLQCVLSQDDLVKKFMAYTLMTEAYAKQCLEENSFIYEHAVNVFNRIRATVPCPIPCEAFQMNSGETNME